jgi:hypothetical protein
VILLLAVLIAFVAFLCTLLLGSVLVICWLKDLISGIINRVQSARNSRDIIRRVYAEADRREAARREAQSRKP